MRRFGRGDLEDFLRAVDGNLVKPVAIVLIGGAAVGLKFKGSHFTTDIDLWESADPAFWEAVKNASASHKSPIPVEAVTIADAPRTFEDRLVFHEIRGLKCLTVYVPDAHDLATTGRERWISAARSTASRAVRASATPRCTTARP